MGAVVRSGTASSRVVHRTVAACAAGAAFLVAAVAACDVHTPVTIPAGAQVVHVSVTETEIAIAPARVHAGAVYLVNEGPARAFQLISTSAGTDGSRGPMTPADADRLARGDFQGTTMEGFDVTCATDQWTDGQHWDGCGENVALTLSEGLYALMAGSETPGVAPAIAILEVTP